MKTREQVLKDRFELFETDGWKDLMDELTYMEDMVKNIDTIQDERDLWHAKGQLQTLGFLLSLESATKLEVEQSE